MSLAENSNPTFAPATGGGSPSGQISVEKIMDGIRREVRASLASSSAARRFPKPSSLGTEAKSGAPLIASEYLARVNATYQGWPQKVSLTSHRKLLGGLVLRFKHYLLNTIWDIFFREYFEREQAFHKHLVYYLNEAAEHVDRRDGEIFWQLIQKLDNDIAAINDKCDRLHDEVFCSLDKIERALELRGQKNA